MTSRWLVAAMAIGLVGSSAGPPPRPVALERAMVVRIARFAPRLAWQRVLQAAPTGEPLVATSAGTRRIVVSTPGVYRHGLTYVLSAADGRVLWRRDAGALAVDDRRVYLRETGRLQAVDAITGQPLWNVSLPTPGPGQSHDPVSAVAGEGLLVWSLPRESARCLRAADGHPVWERPEAYVPHLMLPGRVYASTQSGGGYRLLELDAATGRTVRDVLKPGDDYLLCLQGLRAFAGDARLYADQEGVSVGRELPSLAVLAPDLSTVWRRDMTAWVLSGDVLVCAEGKDGNNNLAAGLQAELVGLDMFGKERWRRSVTGLGPCYGLVAWRGQAVVLRRLGSGRRAGYGLVGLRPADGRPLWSLRRGPAATGAARSVALRSSGDTLYVVAEDPAAHTYTVMAYR